MFDKDNYQNWILNLSHGYNTTFINYALHETGVFKSLCNDGPGTSAELAARTEIDGHLLDGVLHYLTYSDEIIAKEGEKFSLTDTGKQWLFDPRTVLSGVGMVGGYSCLLYHLLPALKNEKKYGVDFERDGEKVAIASYFVGLGTYPWVVNKIRELGKTHVADMGCGSAEVLISLVEMDPNLKGIGIDISQGALNDAAQRVRSKGLENRIKLVRADLTRPDQYKHQISDVEVFNATMVFHEFLRDGEDYVVKMFRNYKRDFPGRYFILGEFDNPTDEEYRTMSKADLMQALFYRYIIHPLSAQGLPMPKESWLRLFEKAGIEVTCVHETGAFQITEYVLKF